MPKYRFKDDKITFSDIMNIFELFEDAYSEIISDKNYHSTFVDKLHSLILNLNEDTEMADVEMYDEEKNGAIVFTIRSKYKCLRAIANTKILMYSGFHSYRYVTYSECRIHKIACAYIQYLEYFFTYSYMVRDEAKQKINAKYGYFKQSPLISCDGEDTGV